MTDYDAVVSFTTPELLRGMWPPVDVENSWSTLIQDDELDRARVAREARDLLARADQLRRALAEPFDHSEAWAGHSTRHVPIREALDRIHTLIPADD